MLDKKLPSSPAYMHPAVYKRYYKEALRLNRLYANEYQCYRRIVKKRQSPAYLEAQKLKAQTLAKHVQHQDKKNTIIDELTDMVWYTYDNASTLTTQTKKKVYVDKLVRDALRGEKPVGQRPTPTQELTQPLTQELLHTTLYYDAELGTFEWQAGNRAGKQVNLDKPKTALKKLRRQQQYVLPIKARSYKPSHAGYKVITEQEYLDIKAGAKNKQVELVYTGSGYKRVNVGAEMVHMRQYMVRTRKERGKPAPVEATERVTYYLKATDATGSNPNLKITLGGKSYPVAWLATLYMGAGGDWDYSNGIDSMQRHPDHIMTAPHGLRQYNPKTNKPVLVTPHDGDWYNLKWDNIKPVEFSIASIIKAPSDTKPKLSTNTYSPKRNIKRTYISHDPMNPRWVVNVAGRVSYEWSEVDAMRVYEDNIKALRGTKRMLKNKTLMVTRVGGSKFY